MSELPTVILRPPPLVRSTPVDFAEFCDRMAAVELTRLIAAAYDLNVTDIWAALHDLPLSAMPLFQTPEGWGLIAAHVVTTITGEPCETALPVVIH